MGRMLWDFQIPPMDIVFGILFSLSVLMLDFLLVYFAGLLESRIFIPLSRSRRTSFSLALLVVVRSWDFLWIGVVSVGIHSDARVCVSTSPSLWSS